MEFLNRPASLVFATLLDSLDGQGYIKIENEPFMPLTLERIGYNVSSPWGKVNLYSLCHYLKVNGDLVQDPEMGFFVADNRNGFPKDWDNLKIGPYYYYNAPSGTYEESIRIEKNSLSVFHKQLQKDHTLFANIWLINIRAQRFLNNLTIKHY